MAAHRGMILGLETERVSARRSTLDGESPTWENSARVVSDSVSYATSALRLTIFAKIMSGLSITMCSNEEQSTISPRILECVRIRSLRK